MASPRVVERPNADDGAHKENEVEPVGMNPRTSAVEVEVAGRVCAVFESTLNLRVVDVDYLLIKVFKKGMKFGEISKKAPVSHGGNVLDSRVAEQFAEECCVMRRVSV